jgi:hypothetical protein
LEGRFGRAANQLTPEEFSSELQRMQVDQRTYLRDAYGSDAVPNLPCLPTDWNFDHYGVVASLVVAAFHGLAKEEQESAEVQSRLTEALLGGREDP